MNPSNIQGTSSSSTSSSASRSRIIRSRQGATTAAGWLSQSQAQAHATSVPPTPPTSEPTTPELSEHVYLEVSEESQPKDASTSKTTLLKCLRKAAMMSTLLADMLNQNDLLTGRQENGSPVLPMVNNPYCSSGAIRNIIAWCEYHCDDPIGEQSITSGAVPTTYRSFDDLEEDRDQYESKYEIPCYWDKSWIQSVGGVGTLTPESRGNLYDLLIAAHYLGIDRLVELGARYICKQISGKGCDEVRVLLNIQNDLDQCEERKIHEENAWVQQGNGNAGGGNGKGTSSSSTNSGNGNRKS